MSCSGLPDEIIKEILSPALRVPDEIFRDNTRDISPFLNFTESTSALLLVCKSWLRVATPLLYHVVVLRSKPQAQALERALRANEVLAKFIKKLRVEGGFGASMHHILRLGKNIEELWLSLAIWSADSVSGLCSGLPLVNPQRLIVSDVDVSARSNSNASTRKLVKTVCECMLKWEKLSIVDLPYHYLHTWSHPSNANTALCAALSKVPLLQTITIEEPQHDMEYLLHLAKNPSLEVIRIRKKSKPGFDGYESFRNPYKGQFLADKTLAKLLRFDSLDDKNSMSLDDILHDQKAESLITFDSSFVALQSVSTEVKTQLWSNIIYFSLLFEIPPDSSNPYLRRRRREAAVYSSLQIDPECINKNPRINILLVSKFFYNTSMRHYYRYCLLDGVDEVSRVGERISRNPSWGSAIYSLTTCSCWSGDANHFRPFILNATNLVHLNSKGIGDRRSVNMLDYQSITVLAARVGSKLQTLTGYSIARAASPRSPAPLYTFTSLRKLDWDSSTQLNFTPKEVPLHAFPSLEILTFVSTNDTFLRLLECMTLPALRRVTFPNGSKMEGAHNFLEKHGKKLTILSMENAKGCWELCPSLSIMVLSGLPVFEPHPKVEAIISTLPVFREGTISEKFHGLGSIDFGTNYPALTQVQVYACRWPTTERDITKGPRSNWVRWSERLMKWNVKLIDKDEKHWKPRLK